MIHYALIVRAGDGLPLTASLDTDNQLQVRESKRLLKVLAKKVKHFPDRCSLLINTKLCVHFTTTLGVSYLVLCEKTYPVVLAFSFLDELVKEFITVYTTHDVTAVLRPYSLIDFDNFIQKTRQRYNNPSSLATKLNLSDLSLEIKLRPPYQLSLDNVYPTIANNGVDSVLLSPVGTSRLPPTNCMDFTAMLLSLFCLLLNFVRGISALSESSFEDNDEASPLHGVTFLVETTLQLFQLFLLVKIIKRHLLWVISSFISICVCNLLVLDVRDLWQILLHVGLAAFVTSRIFMRRPQRKAPNYNV